MAIIRSVRRINPLDINKNVATIGVALPLNSVNLFSGTPTTREQVKTNLLNLILTEKGERINHPNYGLGVKNLLFEQNIDMGAIKEKIHQQVSFYIPEINILSTEIGTSEDQHTIQIKLVYEIRTNMGIPDAIQINISDPFAAYREDESYFLQGRNSGEGHTTTTEYVGGTGYNNSISINNPDEFTFGSPI